MNFVETFSGEVLRFGAILKRRKIHASKPQESSLSGALLYSILGTSLLVGVSQW
jgi:hypothetical protein